jgi:hypothetical protein
MKNHTKRSRLFNGLVWFFDPARHPHKKRESLSDRSRKPFENSVYLPFVPFDRQLTAE